MTFKRRATDCTATGITFPNRLIYLARRWANNGIAKNYEGVMNLIKYPVHSGPLIRDAFRSPVWRPDRHVFFMYKWKLRRSARFERILPGIILQIDLPRVCF